MKRGSTNYTRQAAFKKARYGSSSGYRPSYYKGMPRFTPRVTYAGSLVPMRTGGYKTNTVERKVNDIGTATYQINTTGSITLLANPALGSDFNNRIGRKVVLKSVYIKGKIQTENSLATTAGDTVAQQGRFIIFCDMQPNGAAPAVTDLLVAALPSSQLNLNNRDRFKIYSDKEYVFDPYHVNITATTAYASTGRQIYNVKKYKKLNLEMIFNATNGGTIADINSGALYMLWIGDVAAGANTDLNAIVSTRVRYADA